MRLTSFLLKIFMLLSLTATVYASEREKLFSLFNNDRFTEVLEFCEPVLKKNRKDLLCNYWSGRAAFELGGSNLSAATAYFRQILPGLAKSRVSEAVYLSALYHTGLAEQLRGNCQHALRHYYAYLEKKERAVIWYNVSVCEEMLGRHVKAARAHLKYTDLSASYQ